jgi:GIY-YIG catalytic domain
MKNFNTLTYPGAIAKMMSLGALCLGLACWAGFGLAQQPTALPCTDDQWIAAVADAGQGYSSDEILISDELRQAVLDRVSRDLSEPLDDDQQTALWLRMLNLRKAGKFPLTTTQRGKSVDESVLPVAELAVRAVVDRHRVTTDVVLADPRLRTELQTEAELIRPGVDAHAIRKAVLSLRKRRSLKPELVLKVADWNRTVHTHTVPELKRLLSENAISHDPGVYLFRSPKGYLYIGEASDLANRLAEHLGGSDRASLAEFLARTSHDGADKSGLAETDQVESNPDEPISVELHVFDPQSPAAQVTMRRAYESELIRSRNPRFNLRP